MKNKYTIWQNRDIDFEEMREQYKEAYEVSDEEITEDDIYNYAYEVNDMWLDDERNNLNIKLPEDVVVIADLGLWNGRVKAYKILHERNVAECLYCDDDYVEFYCDDYDLRCTGSHHDGTNHYLYRMWKEGLTDEQKGNFLYKMYKGKATHKDILRYTRSIRPYIAKVYGWKGKKLPVDVVTTNEFKGEKIAEIKSA